jgi:hypothetical protein
VWWVFGSGVGAASRACMLLFLYHGFSALLSKKQGPDSFTCSLHQRNKINQEVALSL